MSVKAVELRRTGYSRQLASMFGEKESHKDVVVGGKIVRATSETLRKTASTRSATTTSDSMRATFDRVGIKYDADELFSPLLSRDLSSISGYGETLTFREVDCMHNGTLATVRSTVCTTARWRVVHGKPISETRSLAEQRPRTAVQPSEQQSSKVRNVRRMLCRGEAVGSDERVGADVRRSLESTLEARHIASLQPRSSAALQSPPGTAHSANRPDAHTPRTARSVYALTTPRVYDPRASTRGSPRRLPTSSTTHDALQARLLHLIPSSLSVESSSSFAQFSGQMLTDVLPQNTGINLWAPQMRSPI